MPQTAKHERIAVFTFGVIFIVAILVLAIAFPNPTTFQYTVFRVVLALAAAGVAAFIPGFLHMSISTWLRAGGALAVFAIVYFFSPAELVYQPTVPKQGEELGFITESAQPADADGLLVHFTIWNRHPYEKLRLTGIQLQELQRIPTELYCCPEKRTELSLKLDLKSGANKSFSTPLETTFEIPPLSSHTFVTRIAVERGINDNNPIVWFGLKANYSTPSESFRTSRSDRIFLANASDPGLPVSYSGAELRQLTSRSDRSFLAEASDTKRLLAWFSPPMSSSKLAELPLIGILGSCHPSIMCSPVPMR